jgi:hypothetical protein
MDQTDDKPALYALTKRQRDAICYALGHYSGQLEVDGPKPNRLGLTPADLSSIATLLEQPSLDFSAVVPLFAEGPDSNAYVLAAAEHVSEGEIEVDNPAVVSRSEDGGAYVMAWVWVSDEDARRKEIDGYTATVSEDGCLVERQVKGRAYSAMLRDLTSTEELVCPTSGMGSDHYHRVESDTIERIAAWAELVEATIPTE